MGHQWCHGGLGLSFFASFAPSSRTGTPRSIALQLSVSRGLPESTAAVLADAGRTSDSESQLFFGCLRGDQR